MEAHPLQRPLQESLQAPIAAAVQWLEDHQHPEGYWAGLLETNVCIEAEWILAFHCLGIMDDPKIPALQQGILDEQRPDGAWEVYYRAPQGDINATVEAYTALRACGLPPDAPPLQRARRWIADHGGLGRTRVFTRYWLAMIGEWPWPKTPNIPPEIIFLPRRFAFNIYNFACWARATLVALAVVSALRKTHPLPLECRLDELFPKGRKAFDYDLPDKGGGPMSWEGFFKRVDRGLHLYQRLGIHPGRRTAVGACLEWIVRHQDADGTWGGIQPPWIYSLLALHAAGYPLTHPSLRQGLAALDTHWSFRKNGGLHIQACESPVWDTLLALQALLDCGMDCRTSPAMHRAVEWILDHEIRVPGDWRFTIKGVEPGGWAFEHANNHYPDIDDTGVALTVLTRLRPSYDDPDRLQAAMARALRWLAAMQSRNGGWGAFDRDNDRRILTRIPFCDFGETLDPPSVDVTAHVLEAFGALGLNAPQSTVRRAIAFIQAEQEPEGCWFGRWGVNYIYGTSAVLCGLRAVGFDMHSTVVRKARVWILDHQNPDGGWGESCESYMDIHARGRGPSTPSQTGWALMALLAVDEPSDHAVVERGAAFLCAHLHQGTWDEPWYTGTGFPGYSVGARMDLAAGGLERRLQQGSELGRGFMINYNLYRHYFPLSALGRARSALPSGAATLSAKTRDAHSSPED
jgi:squalene-hopene/tetraprenyl-beta-curcumene cyclase